MVALCFAAAVALLSCCSARRTFGVSWKYHQAGGELWPSGQEIVAFNHTCEVRASDAPVCVMHHFWAGGNFKGYMDSILRYYVDGERNASVVIPFSLGLGGDMPEQESPWSAGALFGRTGKPSGIFHNYHVPFAKSVRVTVELGGSGSQKFWIILKGTSGIQPRIGGEALPVEARARTVFQDAKAIASSERLPLMTSNAHAGAVLMVSLYVNWTDPGSSTPCSSELVGTGLDMHGGDLGSPIFAATAADCASQCCGQGSCTGFVFEAQTDVQTAACSKGHPCCFLKQSWAATQSKSIASAYRVHRGNSTGTRGNAKSFLEGCVRGESVDGQVQDVLSSGTEDYFLGTYYFNRGKYANPVAGLTDLNDGQRTFAAYRVHDADPVFFEDGFRLSWRNSDPYGVCDLEAENPDAHAVTASSFAYLYEWRDRSAIAI